MHRISSRRTAPLRKQGVSTESLEVVPNHNSLQAFRRRRTVSRNTAPFSRRVDMMKRHHVTALVEWPTDKDYIHSKASQANLRYLNEESTPRLQRADMQRSEIRKYAQDHPVLVKNTKNSEGTLVRPLPVVPRDGTTTEQCKSSEECLGDRFCADRDGQECTGGDLCICVPPSGFVQCSSSSDCLRNGEVCVQLDESTACISQEVANNSGFEVVDDRPSEDEETVSGSDDVASTNPGVNNETGEACIDARALGHFPLNRLVFKTHAFSHVLCDTNDSCATRSHVVMFRGRAMRMRIYCELVGCRQATMGVNSPHFSRGMRIESKTKGLEYTGFAARYDTQVEESVIRMAIRLGL